MKSCTAKFCFDVDEICREAEAIYLATGANLIGRNANFIGADMKLKLFPFRGQESASSAGDALPPVS